MSTALAICFLVAVTALSIGNLGYFEILHSLGNTTSLALIAGGGLLFITSTFILIWRCRKNPLDQAYVLTLHEAAEKNQPDRILALLKFGTPVDSVLYEWMTPFNEITPLRLGKISIQKKLDSMNQPQAARERRWDTHGYTPLHKACIRGSYEAAELLLQKGANPNAKTKLEKTPLDLVDSENPSLRTLLVKHTK